MKRAQTAVPTVLLTIMALIIWYVLWIYPEQRYELLFGESSTETITPEESSYYTTTIGEIGQSSGELLDNQIVSNLSVSYPETRSSVASFDSQILSSSILASEHKTVDLGSVEADKVNVEALISSVVGNPKLSISLNNTLIYNNEISSNSRVTLDITKNSINTYGNVLRITCQFNGYEFWTSQQCGFTELNVYEYVYAPIDTSDSDVFYLTPSSENAELIELSFTPSNSNDFPISLLINSVEVFTGQLTSDEEVTMSIDASDLSLGIDNTIELSASQGAEYTLSNINLDFYSVPSGLASKFVVFDMPGHILEDEDEVIIEFELDSIIEPGDLNLEIVNTQTSYVVLSNELSIGTNTITILTSDLEEIGNNLRVYSTSGRLIIGEFKIR